MSSRPQTWWCDPFWSHFKGRPFDATQGVTDTTLASSVAPDATSISVASATGFVVGEIIALGVGTSWQSFTVAAIVGTTFTIYPKVQTGGFASGQNVIHCWNQTAHPATANSYAAYAQTLSDMKLRRAIAGTDRTVGVGAMTSRYTDARAVANVPVGWESLGTATFTAASYVSTDVLPFSRAAGGIKINAAAVDDGMRTLASIAVTTGESLFAAVFCKHTAGTGFTVKVVDKSSPSTVLATMAAVMGDRTNFNHMSMAQVHVPFQVPAGVTSIEIRILATGTTDECYVDDVRLLRDRQGPTDDRYLFEDPLSATVAWIGDSWAVGASAAAEKFRTAFEARIGRSITWSNLGVSGNRLDDMVTRFETDVVPVAPKLLIIQYGANDISAARSQILMENDADQMLEKCRRYGITPIFVALPAITGSVDLAQQRTEQIRARVNRETLVSDFRQIPVGAPMVMALGATTITSFTFDATNDALEFICQVPAQDTGTVTITRLGYRQTAVVGTPPVFRISIQGVAADGTPDGTVKGGGSPASATFTPSGSATWNWVTLANSYAASRGEMIAIVIDYSSGTLNGANGNTFGQFLASSAVQAFPYTIDNNATVRTRRSAQPIYGFSSATRVYGFPCQLVRATALSSDTTPDEVALRFIFDSPFFSSYQVIGARINGVTGAAAKTIKMILYDGTTVLQDVSIDTDQVFAVAVARSFQYYFDEATLSTLKTGKEYRLSIQPQDTATSVAMHSIDTSVAGDLDAFPGGQTWYYSTRVDAGAWTDVTSSRPLVELIIQDVRGNAPQVVAAVT